MSAEVRMPRHVRLRSLAKGVALIAAAAFILAFRHDQRERRRAQEAARTTAASPRLIDEAKPYSSGPVVLGDPVRLLPETEPRPTVPVVPDDLAHLLPRYEERVYLPWSGNRVGAVEVLRPPAPGHPKFDGAVEIVRPY